MDESDCCGNGCANCILDVGLQKIQSIDRLGKFNIISNYRKFKLVEKCYHQSSTTSRAEINVNSLSTIQVLELHFACIEDSDNANDYILDIPPGHHVMLRANLPTGEICLRPYSPFWVDASTKEFKILVNLKPNGPMSQYIAELRTEDELEVRGPIGRYMHNVDCGQNQCICIVSQGVAVASTIRIVQQILENDDDMARVHQFTCFIDLPHMYFRDVLREFSKYWNYRSCSFLAHQECSNDICSGVGNKSCRGDCEDFLKNLRYKEVVLLRRLNEVDLRDFWTSAGNAGERFFIIAGIKAFQESIVKMIQNAELPVKTENIFLL